MVAGAGWGEAIAPGSKKQAPPCETLQHPWHRRDGEEYIYKSLCWQKPKINPAGEKR